jgi:hypothetical protein
MTRANFPAQAEAVELLRVRYPAQSGTIPDQWQDFVYRRGSIPDGLAYGLLFVPPFIEVEGSVLLDDCEPGFPERFLAAKRKSDSELGELEASFNWREVGYLFANPEGEDEEELVLAELIAEAWRARLTHLYPKRRFVVRVMMPDETGSIYGVGFVELR